MGRSPEVFVAALDRTFRDRATGGCGTPADVTLLPMLLRVPPRSDPVTALIPHLTGPSPA